MEIERQYLGLVSDTTTKSTYTFNGFPAGVEDEYRWLVLSIAARGSDQNVWLNDVKVNGVSATYLTGATYLDSGSSQVSELAIIKVPTGSTVNVSVEFENGSMLRCSVAAWRLTGIKAPGRHSFYANDGNASQLYSYIEAPADSIVFSTAMQGGAATNPRWTSGDTVQDFGAQFQTNGYHTGSSKIAETVQAIYADFRTDNTAPKTLASVVLVETYVPPFEPEIPTGGGILLKTRRDIGRNVSDVPIENGVGWTNFLNNEPRSVPDTPNLGDTWESLAEAMRDDSYQSQLDKNLYYVDSVKLTHNGQESETELVDTPMEIGDFGGIGDNSYTVMSFSKLVGIDIGADRFRRTGIGFNVYVRREEYYYDFELGDYPEVPSEVYYLNALALSGFDDLVVPKDSSVIGATAQLLMARQLSYAGPGISYQYLLAVGPHLEVNYEYKGKLGGVDEEYGYARIRQQPYAPVSQKKSYQYNVYEKSRFLNEYRGVSSDILVKNSVNQLPGEMNITINRDLKGGVDDLDDIAITGYDLEGEEPGSNLLLTSDQESLLATVSVAKIVGDGTDIAKNNYVDVREYYGGYESLVTSDTAEEILTSDTLEPIVLANGYPLGRSMYKGFISKYRFGYTADGAATTVKLLSHTDEYNHIVFETSDTVRVENLIDDNANGQDVQDWLYGGRWRYTAVPGKYAQTFQVTSVTDMSAVSLLLARGGYTQDDSFPTVKVELKLGTPTGAGAVISSATKQVTNHVSKGLEEVVFSFNGITLPSSTTYSLIVTIDGATFEPQSFGYTPVAIGINRTNPYANGSASVFTYVGETEMKQQPDTWSALTGADLAFRIWQRGGNTLVTKNSMEPAQMLRDAIGFAKTRGSQLTFSATSIIDTGTIVSGRFNTNKMTDVVQTILKYSPSDWYTFYDPATLEVNLLPRPTVVKHWFELGKNIEELFIEESIEDLVNEVYFSGGVPSGQSKNLMQRFVDTASQSDIRRGLSIISDQRVIDPATMEIMAMSEIDRSKAPIYAGTVKILRKFYSEFVQPGDMIGFRGTGNFVDQLRLQAVMVTTSSDRIEMTLGIMLPPVSKRVEDIRRNLELLEMENNPTSPS